MMNYSENIRKSETKLEVLLKKILTVNQYIK